jgi:hypothetical protein
MAQGKEMGEDRSLRFAMELFCSAANQESSKQEYRGVLRSLGRHLDQAGISRARSSPGPGSTPTRPPSPTWPPAPATIACS